MACYNPEAWQSDTNSSGNQGRRYPGADQHPGSRRRPIPNSAPSACAFIRSWYKPALSLHVRSTSRWSGPTGSSAVRSSRRSRDEAGPTTAKSSLTTCPRSSGPSSAGGSRRRTSVTCASSTWHIRSSWTERFITHRVTNRTPPGPSPTPQLGREDEPVGVLNPDLSWTHYQLLTKVESEHARGFYEIEAVRNHLSSRELEFAGFTLAALTAKQ